jgi:hypothetical protein
VVYEVLPRIAMNSMVLGVVTPYNWRKSSILKEYIASVQMGHSFIYTSTLKMEIMWYSKKLGSIHIMHKVLQFSRL